MVSRPWINRSDPDRRRRANSVHSTMGKCLIGPQIYKKSGNLRAAHLLLGHTKLESIVRYLGIEVDYALGVSEQVEL